MHPSPEAARILHTLIALEPNLWRKARRCRALLADELSDYPAEQIALRRALSLGVPDEIAATSGTEPAATVIARLSASLQSAEAMRADLAHWAVTAWAEAVGVRAPLQSAQPARVRPARTENTPAIVDAGKAVDELTVPTATISRNPWPWALVAAPFVVLAVVWILRAINSPQYELDAMWHTATRRQIAFLGWYLPPAIVIAAVTMWLYRRKRARPD